MYVTRRLLRSTLPSEESKSGTNKDATAQATPCASKRPVLPPATPKRRAAVRASAKICAVIADASGPAARRAASSSSASGTSKTGQMEASESRRAGGRSHRKKPKRASEPAGEAVAKLHGFERLVDVRYLQGEYAEARILNLDVRHERVLVHYMGWNARYDAWVPLQDVAAHGTHSGAARKSSSWTGKPSLFASVDAAAGKGSPTAGTDGLEPEMAVKKPEKRESSRSRSRGGAHAGGERSARVRRSARRVQVAVGTTDEAGEAQERTRPADMELDVDFQGEENMARHENTHAATSTTSAVPALANSGAGDGKKKRKSGKSSGSAGRKKAKKTSATVAVPVSSARALGGAAREKLTAIFRLRVQQRQQLEQLDGQDGGFQQQLLQDERLHATATASAEAGVDEYQRQLQQYYYQQQVLLSSSLSLGEDPSTLPLEGGVLDPRVIQQRLAALEERRRQQLQIQAYYRQLLFTRERNVRALAANEAFVSGGATAWQQQMKASQAQDVAGVASWKDLADALDVPTGTKAKATASDASASAASTSTTADDAEAQDERVASPDSAEKAPEEEASNDADACKACAEGSGVLYEFVL